MLIVTTPRLVLTETTRRWAAVLRQIFEVDPLVCPRCAGAMRIVACITQAAVIGQILTHLRTRAVAGPTGRSATRANGRQTYVDGTRAGGVA